MTTLKISSFEGSQEELNCLLLGMESFAPKNFSDGYHTFEELYAQRTMLFAMVVRQAKGRFKKSYLHSDFTFFEGMFIVQGIIEIDSAMGNAREQKQISFHIKNEYWDYFHCQEVAKADKRDGHTSEDVIEIIKQSIKNS